MPQPMNHAGRLWAAAALAIAAMLAAPAAPAQSWRPDKPVEIVSPTAPGGSNDVIARIVQRIAQNEKLVTVPINVVNRTGGNHTIARTYISQHPGDAHYLHADSPSLLGNYITGITPLGHHDFTPIALLVSEYTVFTVKADSPIRNARDLVEQLKKDPESVGVGISSRGGTNHLALSLLAKSAGVDPRKLKIVVFKSNTDAAAAVAGGHLQLSVSSLTAQLSQVTAGRIRLISVSAPQRASGVLATVPTLREQGYDVSLANWRALSGPKGLTSAQVAFWEDTLSKVVATEDWKKSLEAQSWDPTFLRSRAFAKYLDDEYAETKAIMVELGLVK
jgi:putative tricarboxylic transport membrane protein